MTDKKQPPPRNSPPRNVRKGGRVYPPAKTPAPQPPPAASPPKGEGKKDK